MQTIVNVGCQQVLQIIILVMQASYLPPAASSNQILQLIHKHPYTQKLQGEDLTYSILCKKQRTFLFGNDRFLLLKGIESISYARELPARTRLPFAHPAELPPPKTTFPLSEIEHFASQQELLIIQFSGDKKLRWQFVCPSKLCALEWHRKLEQATQAFAEFSLSGYSTFQEFLSSKETAAQQQYQQQYQQHSEANAMLNFNDNASLQSQAASRARNISSASNRMQQNIQSNLLSTLPSNNYQSQMSPYKIEQEQASLIPITNIDKDTGVIAKQQPKEIANLANFNQFNPQKQMPVQNEGEIQRQLAYSPSSIFNSNMKIKPISENNSNYSPIESFKQIDKSAILLFQGSKIAKPGDLSSDKLQSRIVRSISQLSTYEREKLKSDIAKLRRNWVEELIAGEEIVSLVLDFKNYVQSIAEVIVNELHMPREGRMYPPQEQTREYAVYLHEDLQLQIYFYSEEHLIQKNPKYREAALEFKNFDYLLGACRNQGPLKVPLALLFEFKGFLGMAKMRIHSNGQSANKELYNAIDRRQFEDETKICADSLLNESHCKIVRYEGESTLTKMINNGSKVYFIQKLTQFLPAEASNRAYKLLRPQFVQDQEIDDVVFRHQSRNIKQERVNDIIQRKISLLVNALQNGKEYFTNSKELSQIMHSFGLNMRHIGAISQYTKQPWLRRLLRDDIIGRCLKNYFRFDVQNVVKQGEQSLQRQEERERNRVISFLNVIFGNTETTFRVWRNLNSFAQESFGVKIWENQFSDINVPYLLQALQNSLKITLSSAVLERKHFKSMNTFEPKDFIGFRFEANTYNLDFSQIFEDIHECLQDETFESFHSLCEVLTQETHFKLTYFQALRQHSINNSIREFLFEFTSPLDNHDLYKRIEEAPLPSCLLYQSKLAEIKWHLKSGKHEEANRPAAFLQNHLRKWVGEIHPLFTTLNRLLAEYFLEQQLFYGTAIKHAQASLEMQQALFGGEVEQLWKDYFLLGKIHFLNKHPQDALTFLTRAKALVNVQALTEFEVYGDLCLMLAKGYFAVRYYKQAYSTAKELYRLIRNQRDERSLAYIVESVAMIKQLLDINQEHESFERFVETDFSQIVVAFAEYPQLMSTCIKMIAIPNLKNTLLRNSKNRTKLLTIIDTISKITQPSQSCIGFIKAKIMEGTFPRNYQQCLKDIDAVIEEIEQNQMLERWCSFNKMANEAILDKISGSINRVFQFMAFLTAIFNLLGPDVLGQLSIMEK